MRKALKDDLETRKTFRGTFVRIGKKTGFKGYSSETILLKNIINIETGEVVTDHIWLNFTKAFESLTLQEGNLIEFQARVVVYKKGYINKRYNFGKQKEDYKLSHPTKIKIVT